MNRTTQMIAKLFDKNYCFNRYSTSKSMCFALETYICYILTAIFMIQRNLIVEQMFNTSAILEQNASYEQGGTSKGRPCTTIRPLNGFL